jgi:hypothetical protein
MYRSPRAVGTISRQTVAAILSMIEPERDDGSSVIAIATGASAIVTGDRRDGGEWDRDRSPKDYSN